MELGQELRPEAWVKYFNALGAAGARLVTVQVVHGRTGRAREEPRRLHTIEYDPKSGVLQLAVGGHGGGRAVVLRHFISDPQRIEIDGGEPLSPVGILVDDASGIRTSIRFFDGPPTARCREVVHRPCEIVHRPSLARASWRRSRCVIAESPG